MSTTAFGRSCHRPLQIRAMKRVEAHAVDELGRPLDVPDGEVRGLARLQRPGLAEQAQRPRGFARDAGEALVDRHAEQRRGHVHGQQQRGERRGAGVASVASAMGTPCWRKRSIGGCFVSRMK